MDKFIPREKLGKKARKELDRQRRATWSFSPTTRRVENRKRYNRKARERFESELVGFCFSQNGSTLFVRHAVFRRFRIKNPANTSASMPSISNPSLTAHFSG